MIEIYIIYLTNCFEIVRIILYKEGIRTKNGTNKKTGKLFKGIKRRYWNRNCLDPLWSCKRTDFSQKFFPNFANDWAYIVWNVCRRGSFVTVKGALCDEVASS